MNKKNISRTYDARNVEKKKESASLITLVDRNKTSQCITVFFVIKNDKTNDFDPVIFL